MKNSINYEVASANAPFKKKLFALKYRNFWAKEATKTKWDTPEPGQVVGKDFITQMSMRLDAIKLNDEWSAWNLSRLQIEAELYLKNYLGSK